jgi:hypothetical protein
VCSKATRGFKRERSLLQRHQVASSTLSLRRRFATAHQQGDGHGERIGAAFGGSILCDCLTRSAIAG